VTARATWAEGPVTVRVPATSANLGPGFDSLGLALTLHDTVEARLQPSGLSVKVTGVGADTASHGERHLVVVAIRAACAVIGDQPPGLAIHCGNDIPHGFGLGSSAAAIVAGLLAGRALAGDAGRAALPDTAILRLACELDGHADNVAACLAGGVTIAWAPAQPGASPRSARLQPLPGLVPVVCLPDRPLSTKVARQALPDLVPHADAAANSARAALLVTALTSRPDLLMDATEDYLHQRYRSAAMPASAGLVARLRAAGIPAAVSGAGPAVLALTMAHAREGVTAVSTIAGTAGDGWRVLPLAVEIDGARVTVEHGID
jgi:homoserine kinase